MASSKPYKATELWLEMHSAFRGGLPVGRHRRYMKSYNKCFVASDAVTWMTDYIIKHPVFRQNIPRANTVQLLRKFHQAQIFEDVRGTKYDKEEFADNNRLFRFCDDGEESTRLPLSTINQDKLKTRPPVKPPSKQSQLVASISPQQIEDTWKTVTLAKLQNSLRLSSLADIVDGDSIDAKNIMHNTTHISKNGVVIDTKNPSQLPQWVIAAMKYVAYYPQKDRDMKYYDGFEKDAFGVVRTYFEELNHALISDEMYELFVRVFLYTQKDLPQESPDDPAEADTETPLSVTGLKTCTSVENLIMDLTIVGSVEGSEKSPVDAEITFNPGESFHYPSDYPANHKHGNNQPAMKPFDPSRTLPLRPDSEIRKARHMSSPVVSGQFNPARTLPMSNLDFYHDGAPNHCLTHNHGSHSGKARPLSMAPSTRFETSFSVTDNEPRTYVYAKRPASESWYDQGSQKTSHSSQKAESLANPEVHSGVWSDESYTGDEVGLSVSQRTVSMTDISQMVPCPENELAKQERLTTWLQNQNHYDTGQEPSYGYTVVVSTTPNPKLAQKRVHGQSSSNLARVEFPQDFNKFDHNYCTTVNPMTQSAWELEASPIYLPDPPCLASRPAPPPYVPRSVSPPYVPPPSYESLYKPQNPFSLFLDEDKKATTSSSSSTYETAATHLTPSSLPRSISQPAQAMSCHSSTSNLLSASVAALPKKDDQPKLTKMASESVVHSHSRSCGPMRQRSMSLSHHLTRSRTNLTESYRRAMAINGASMTPTGHSLYGASSVSDLTMEQASDRTREALQLCTLLLPPSNRRKLHLLLRFMWRVGQNEELELDENGGDTYIMVLDVFTRCVIWSSDVTDEEKLMLRTLVEYLVIHHDTIMRPPPDLHREVEVKLQQLRQVKVTLTQYESQRLSSSQRALQGLLEGIVSNKHLSGREKHKKLKQFQKAHPDIYSRRFPSGMIGGSMDNISARTSSKQTMKPLLKRPLQKLRSIRL